MISDVRVNRVIRERDASTHLMIVHLSRVRTAHRAWTNWMVSFATAGQGLLVSDLKNEMSSLKRFVVMIKVKLCLYTP
jgi:hypothetical protein